MKTENIKKLTLLFAVSLILCLPMFGGCQKNEMNKREDNGSVLPLIGTTWKLVGFADTKHDSIDLAKPSGEDTYLLSFKDDGSISGSTSTNQAGGVYVLTTLGKLSFVHFGPSTFINELFDGHRYIEAMNEVSSYQISAKGLSLYYGKDTYLLFHSAEDE